MARLVIFVPEICLYTGASSLNQGAATVNASSEPILKAISNRKMAVVEILGKQTLVVIYRCQ